jgi:pyridoxal phosphate-dependent aminotransferase EpsN
VVAVHLYGQTADLERLVQVCQEFEVPLVEDAAEALGATWQGQSPGTLGKVGIFSFNGNKIITTSGGGMLVTDDERLATRARKLATQARDPAPHYQHSELGYNYRLSNLLAAVGRGQLKGLSDRVAKRREIFEGYRRRLSDLPGLAFQPEASWGTHSRWLTTLLVDEEQFGADRDQVCSAMEARNIEARPVWKPMHLQPLFEECRIVGGTVAAELFRQGLCLPSGSAMTDHDLNRVVDILCSQCRSG